MIRQVVKGAAHLGKGVAKGIYKGAVHTDNIAGAANSNIGKRLIKGGTKVGKSLVSKHARQAGDFIPYKLSTLGLGLAIGGGMVVDGAETAFGAYNRGTLGEISSGQLSSLISEDSSGISEAAKTLSRGNYGVFQDMTQGAFQNNINNYGATGDLVFALHNLRE